eukprot:TRINITY_DN1038_c0_g2_i10.p1 TRINITY_DN1038_c0_g2~~TRINITY_DN1038_c0_g2_i10.p1  ORF type:complete len:181 (-),score=40.20 TRINITY_DN1038_c0_g2_i10:83-565(-)
MIDHLVQPVLRRSKRSRKSNSKQQQQSAQYFDNPTQPNNKIVIHSNPWLYLPANDDLKVDPLLCLFVRNHESQMHAFQSGLSRRLKGKRKRSNAVASQRKKEKNKKTRKERERKKTRGNKKSSAIDTSDIQSAKQVLGRLPVDAKVVTKNRRAQMLEAKK